MKLRPDQREIITPEGLALRFTLAGRSARLGALLVDLICIGVILLLRFLLWSMPSKGCPG
jgi:uncharacterized RDD family membrane protein YckC